MRKLLGLVLAFASIGGIGLASEANANEVSLNAATVAANASPQWERNRRGRYNNRRRSVTRTRVVRVGRRLYRETYVVRYLPNGRVHTQLISRVRVS